MADIKLFNIKGKVQEYQSGTVTLEKELQTVIENNMETFFGVTFLASEYRTTDGGRITYGLGEGGYSNSRKADLGDTIGSRDAYCVQPEKVSPVVGKMTVDKVVTDENETGKWNALRNIVYYAPSYPGYDNNVKNIKSASYYNGSFTHDWAVAHLAMSYVYAKRPSDMATFGNTMASDLGEI